MDLSVLTTPAVPHAIDEFEKLGRDSFLRQYGFGRARGYFIVHNGRQYDSKAIAGVAYRYLGGNRRALRPSEFDGGDRTVAKQMRALGFEVAGPLAK